MSNNISVLIWKRGFLTIGNNPAPHCILPCSKQQKLQKFRKIFRKFPNTFENFRKFPKIFRYWLVNQQLRYSRVIFCFAVKPEPPIILEVATTSTTITINWRMPANTGGSPILGYKVQASREGANGLCNCTGTDNNYTKSCRIEDLHSETEYVVEVYARNVVGFSQPATKTVATKEAGE